MTSSHAHDLLSAGRGANATAVAADLTWMVATAVHLLSSPSARRQILTCEMTRLYIY